jgi:hypothetical protein
MNTKPCFLLLDNLPPCTSPVPWKQLVRESLDSLSDRYAFINGMTIKQFKNLVNDNLLIGHKNPPSLSKYLVRAKFNSTGHSEDLRDEQ